jgi:DNA-binding transcriptional ArsR family regulator
VAAAIADPVRRDILMMLRERGLPAGQIADRFPISRPAVSRHLRVLRESGLVHDTLVGRQRVYELDPSRFTDLVEWLDQVTSVAGTSAVGAPAAGTPTAGTPTAAWQRRLDALETEVYRTRRERQTAASRDASEKETA